jgi:pimeloyl-ACP methyl ester carboxylesterase
MGWSHGYAEANGIRIHHVRHGSGSPLMLLHGWPEFWYAYRKNVPILAERLDVIAPDLRGFGDTEKPGLRDRPSGPLDVLAEGLRGLADFPRDRALRTRDCLQRLKRLGVWHETSRATRLTLG